MKKHNNSRKKSEPTSKRVKSRGPMQRDTKEVLAELIGKLKEKLDPKKVAATSAGEEHARGELRPNLDRLTVGVDLGDQWSHYCICTANNLENNIDLLVQKGHLAADQADFLHLQRFMGNAAAHEIAPPEQTELRAALDIAENLLTNLYVLPTLAKKMKKVRLSSQPETHGLAGYRCLVAKMINSSVCLHMKLLRGL